MPITVKQFPSPVARTQGYGGYEKYMNGKVWKFHRNELGVSIPIFRVRISCAARYYKKHVKTMTHYPHFYFQARFNRKKNHA